MAFNEHKKTWQILFYSSPNEVDSYLKNRTIPCFTNKINIQPNPHNTLEHIYSEYLNKLPCSNSIYRKLERGEYTDDEYLKPKTDEYGCDIEVDEDNMYDIDEYDDFEERVENYSTEDEYSSSSYEEEWTNV